MLACSGDLMYIRNYEPKRYADNAGRNGTPFPVWWSEACIYVGGGKYSGIGVKNLTEAQLRAKLADAWRNEAKAPLDQDQFNAIQFTDQHRIKILR